MCKGTILYFGFFGLPDHDASANRVLNNAKVLRDLGYNVVFLDEQVDYPFKGILESKRIVNGFTVYSQRRPHGLKASLIKMISFQNVRKIVDDNKKINLLIAYNYPSIALERIRKLYKNQISVCADCTEWYSGKEYRFPLNILCALDSFYRMRFVHKHLSGVMCISSFLYNYYGKSKQNVLIPPLVDKTDDVWQQETLDYDKSKLNLIYGGAPGRDKEKMSPIVRAVCESPCKENIVLRIVGLSLEQYLDVYPEDDEIIKANDGVIFFFGRIPHRQYIQMLMSSDYLIFLRNRTRVTMAGFSTKFVEAVSVGVPVITTNTGDLKGYIEKYHLGVVLNNKESLKQCLENLPNKTKNKLKNKGLFDYPLYRQCIKEWLGEVVHMKELDNV